MIGVMYIENAGSVSVSRNACDASDGDAKRRAERKYDPIRILPGAQIQVALRRPPAWRRPCRPESVQTEAERTAFLGKRILGTLDFAGKPSAVPSEGELVAAFHRWIAGMELIATDFASAAGE